MKTIVGLFDNRTQADKAVSDLERAGIPRNDVSFIANNEGGQYGANPAAATTGTVAHTGSATVADAEVGAGIGGVLGLLAGASLFVIPGLGWLAGAGWLAGLIGGAVTGGIVGGLVGVLTHIGVPHEDATYYNEGVRRGGILLAVKSEDAMASRVAQILGDDGAVDIDERATQWRQEGFMPTPQTPVAKPISTVAATPVAATNPLPTNPTPPQRVSTTPSPVASAMDNRTLNREGETVLPVVEEELQVGKREVQRGGVRVYTHTTERPVEENVTLHEERVNVERRPVDRPANPAELNNLQDRTFEVTERAEEVIVGKQARVVEEVIVNKEATDRVETVRDTVRRTDVEVDQLSGGKHVSRNAASYDSFANDFRNHWQANYSNQGGRFEDYEPSYRYGYEMAGNSQYQGKNWNAIENNVQRDWNTRYPNTWDRMKSTVRYGFDRAAGDRMPGEGSVPGVQTGGRTMDGTPDTRGITEKIADTVTGDRIDDKTGRRV